MPEPIQIVYEDGAILVCVKPAGLSSEGDLPARLQAETGGEALPVHRLDTPVGGLMVYARDRCGAAALSRAMTMGTFDKEYLAVVPRAPEPETGELRDLLFKDAKRNKSYVVKRPRKGVREAVLTYALAARAGDLALLRIRLQTGRSHQIRVQFAARGLPLLGDVKYGSAVRDCPIALWSNSLSFPHPVTGEPLRFQLPPPERWPWTAFMGAPR